MNSQDTIEDSTLYLDMLSTIDSDQSNKAPLMEDDQHSIQSISPTLDSPECEKDAKDNEENKERMRGQPGDEADSAPHPKLETMLVLVTQLKRGLNQLKERVKETASKTEQIVDCLENLKDDLTIFAGKSKGQTQQQDRGVLKRVKGQGDDMGSVGREGKRPRVTWKD